MYLLISILLHHIDVIYCNPGVSPLLPRALVSLQWATDLPVSAP